MSPEVPNRGNHGPVGEAGAGRMLPFRQWHFVHLIQAEELVMLWAFLIKILIDELEKMDSFRSAWILFYLKSLPDACNTCLPVIKDNNPIAVKDFFLVPQKYFNKLLQFQLFLRILDTFLYFEGGQSAKSGSKLDKFLCIWLESCDVFFFK